MARSRHTGLPPGPATAEGPVLEVGDRHRRVVCEPVPSRWRHEAPMLLEKADVSFRDDILLLLRHMWGDKVAVGFAAISATALFILGPLVLILDAQPRTRAAVIVLFGATGLAAALHWLHPAVFT